MNNIYRKMCAEVLAYYEGLGEYNFTHLNRYDRDNAAFDAWQRITTELKHVLAQSELSDFTKDMVAESIARRGMASLVHVEPEGPGEFSPFVVRHYTDDERPSIKGNGFDGLEIGEDRQEAEEFIAWINERICPKGLFSNG